MSAQEQCRTTVGTKPDWMGTDQYDRCECQLPEGHSGEHKCSHDLAEAGERAVSDLDPFTVKIQTDGANIADCADDPQSGGAR